MTVPLDMGLTFGIGLTFGMAGDEEVKEAESATETNAFRKGLVYNTVAVLGISSLYYKIAPDWMLMYYADHKKIPKLVKLGMFSLYNLMYTLGFLLVRELESKREGLSRVALACCGLLVGALTLSNLKRLFLVGTTDEFEKGEAKIIFKTPLGPALSGGMAIAIASFIKLIRDLVKG